MWKIPIFRTSKFLNFSNNKFQNRKCPGILTWTTTRATTRRKRKITPKVEVAGELCLGSLSSSPLCWIWWLSALFWWNRMPTQSSIKVSQKLQSLESGRRQNGIIRYEISFGTILLKLCLKYFHAQNVILYQICHFLSKGIKVLKNFPFFWERNLKLEIFITSWTRRLKNYPKF